MKNENIADWLNKLGSKTPTPGGGAVAGLNGAIATAQLKMVCEYTKEDKIRENADSLELTIQEFLSFADDDSKVYSQIREAYASKDDGKIAEASEASIKVSSDIVTKIEEILVYISDNLNSFNKNFSPDLIVTLANIKATLRGCSAMIRVNMKPLENKESADQTIKKCNKLLYDASDLINTLENA